MPRGFVVGDDEDRRLFRFANDCGIRNDDHAIVLLGIDVDLYWRASREIRRANEAESNRNRRRAGIDG